MVLMIYMRIYLFQDHQKIETCFLTLFTQIARYHAPKLPGVSRYNTGLFSYTI